jgi:hypothetical protein
VRATFTLDHAAVARVGSTAAVRLDDLQHSGWTVARDATSITLTHDFASMSELAQLLSPAEGVLRDPRLVHEHDRFSTKDRFSVVADTRSLGTGVKADAALMRRLKTAGVNVDAIATQLDRELRDAVHLTLTLQLANGTTRTEAVRNGALTTVTATSSTTSGAARAGLIIAGGALAALALGLLLLSVRRKRRATRETQ